MTNKVKITLKLYCPGMGFGTEGKSKVDRLLAGAIYKACEDVLGIEFDKADQVTSAPVALSIIAPIINHMGYPPVIEMDIDCEKVMDIPKFIQAVLPAMKSFFKDQGEGLLNVRSSGNFDIIDIFEAEES